MEALYSKLYDKYTTLKKEKESQFDKLNREQEVKFLNYEAAANELIQYLKSENDKLQEQVGALKDELTSIRASSNEQCIQFQQLLMHEKQKNTELSEEILKLQNVEHRECSHCITPKETGCGEKNLHDAVEESEEISLARWTKKHKSIHNSEGASVPHVDVELDHPSDQLFTMDKSNSSTSFQQPACCQRKTYSSGEDAADTSSFSCMFQYLVEFLVGLKVSPLVKSNEPSILVHHQSSGYSFSLTWLNNSEGEVKLLYRASSLGTFQKIAPEWMKETLIFSTGMCRIFFERVSRVINNY